MLTDRSKFVPHTYCLAIVRPGETEPWAQHWSATPFQSFNVGDEISAYIYGAPSKGATGFPPGEQNVKHASCARYPSSLVVRVFGVSS